MNITYKEQLSRHVENIFMGYAKPGLHICDIAQVVENHIQ